MIRLLCAQSSAASIMPMCRILLPASASNLEPGLQAIDEVNKKLSSSLFRRVIGSKVVTTVEPFDGEYWLAEVRTNLVPAILSCFVRC